MPLQTLENFGPQLLFFLAFFIAFTILELLIILMLNSIELKGWKFMVDVIIRAEVEHGKVAKWAVLLLLAVITGILAWYTPIIDVLVVQQAELQWFALALLVAMVLIYITTTRKLAKLKIEKKIHKYLYTLISLVLFVAIMLIMSESYREYNKFVNTTFVDPAVQQLELKLEALNKEALLEEFREMARNGECTPKDYRDEAGAGIYHFLYVTTDVEFIQQDGVINVDDPESYVKGRLCENDEEAFLITPYGNWYWVVKDVQASRPPVR